MSSTEIEQFAKNLKAFGNLDALDTLPSARTLNEEKTYKLYIGGKQARADTQSSRALSLGGQSSSVHCLLADASRKDVRNAVEAAQSAYGPWFKRANFNKAQIIFYFGENFNSRTTELAQKLELFTGNSKAECEKELKLCSDVIFYFASLCDKSIGRLNVRIFLYSTSFSKEQNIIHDFF